MPEGSRGNVAGLAPVRALVGVADGTDEPTGVAMEAVPEESPRIEAEVKRPG